MTFLHLVSAARLRRAAATVFVVTAIAAGAFGTEDARAVASTATYSGAAVPIGDPTVDGPGEGRAVLPVSGVDGTIADVNVRINGDASGVCAATPGIRHTSTGDLQINVIAPNNASVRLATNRGGGGDNFCGTVFDDEAAVAVSAGAAPFTGSFRPEGGTAALAVFDGLDPEGNWTLQALDVLPGDTGQINSFSLVFDITPTPTTSTAAPTSSTTSSTSSTSTSSTTSSTSTTTSTTSTTSSTTSTSTTVVRTTTTTASGGDPVAACRSGAPVPSGYTARRGTPGDDRIVVGSGKFIIYAGAGNDTIESGGGNDIVCAGTGDDRITTNGGADSVSGGAGRDVISGGAGNDKLYGGDDDDTVNGGAGDDLVNGGNGNDKLFGGAGNDNIQGANGNDELSGGDGNDTLNGGAGTDRGNGGAGSNTSTSIEGPLPS